MEIVLEKNSIFITDSEKSLMLKATMNFERVVEGDNEEHVGILPVFGIFVKGLENTEECKNKYKDYYKEMLAILGGMFADVYYINYLEGEDGYCLKETLVEQKDGLIPTKVPMKTELTGLK